MPQNAGRAIWFALILWGIGFAWGSVVFMTPSLKAAAPIPFASSNPWISVPILLAWLPLAYILASRHLRSATDPASQGLKLGLVFAITNLALDLLVIVVLLEAGWSYFASLSVVVGYALLLVVPWWVGRSRETRERR